MANAVSANFGTDVSALQNKLNMMTTLNGVHPESVFEYAIDQLGRPSHLDKDGGEDFGGLVNYP